MPSDDARVGEREGRERLATLLFYAAVLVLAWLVYRIFEPFLVPLMWAAVLAVVFQAWNARLEKRWSRSTAAGVTTLLVTLVLIVPTLLLMTAFVNEGIQTVAQAREAFAQGRIPQIENAWNWIRERVPGAAQWDLGALGRKAAETIGGFLASRAGAVLGNVAGFFIDLFVMLFALFFFFRDHEKLMGAVRRMMPFEEDRRTEMINQARELIQASVTSSLIVGAVQGALGGITFALLGLNGAIFWGVVMAFCALIPLLGTGIVLGPAVLWLLINGSFVKAGILAAVAIGVIGLADNFLRPILIGNKAQLGTLLIFISVLGGISAFGMVGLVMGPIVVATALSVANAYSAPVAKKKKE